MKNCGQVNIPKTDNTLSACESFVRDECIVLTQNMPMMEVYENDSLQDFMQKVERQFILKNKVIQELIERIEILESKNL